MRIHDITLAIRPGRMPVWPGDPQSERTIVWQIGPDSPANVSAISMSVHTGTHVDAPIHFIAGGSSAEALELDRLVGPCLVREVRPADHDISASDLDRLDVPPGTQRLLLKTANSEIWERSDESFHHQFIALTADAARWIVAHGIRLVGVDYLSVEPVGVAEPVVHRTLLGAGVIPLEGVNLSGIAPGVYLLVCLPLKLAGSDGAPARVVLIEDEVA